uniref:Uncharacterized protein n=1 Tax=Aegilops tauschii subsp. strangulata TaxID=200361 RepID=A0A453DH52_AEGTS
ARQGQIRTPTARAREPSTATATATPKVEPCSPLRSTESRLAGRPATF